MCRDTGDLMIRTAAPALVLTALLGCSAEVTVPALTPEQVAAAPAQFSLRSQELSERFRAAPASASRELVGKVVEVAGRVELVGLLETGEPYVLLAEEPKGSRPVKCLVTDMQPWRTLVPGLKATLQGQVLPLDKTNVPTLRQAVIVGRDEAGAGKVAYAAEELCESFASDPQAAEKRFHETWGWVRGRIESVDQVNGMLYLDGPGNSQIGCGTANADHAWESSLKPGMVVVIMGQLMKGSRRGLGIRSCRLAEVVDDSAAGDATGGGVAP